MGTLNLDPEHLAAGLRRTAQRAVVEARAGAPASMVAYYVDIEARHTLAGHTGSGIGCAICERGPDGPQLTTSTPNTTGDPA